jgi:hypothetical protein
MRDWGGGDSPPRWSAFLGAVAYESRSGYPQFVRTPPRTKVSFIIEAAASRAASRARSESLTTEFLLCMGTDILCLRVGTAIVGAANSWELAFLLAKSLMATPSTDRSSPIRSTGGQNLYRYHFLDSGRPGHPEWRLGESGISPSADRAAHEITSSRYDVTQTTRRHFYSP